MRLMNWKDEAYLRKAEDGRFIPIVGSYTLTLFVLDWKGKKLTGSLLGGV